MSPIEIGSVFVVQIFGFSIYVSFELYNAVYISWCQFVVEQEEYIIPDRRLVLMHCKQTSQIM